jgi:hypothetical protein
MMMFAAISPAGVLVVNSNRARRSRDWFLVFAAFGFAEMCLSSRNPMSCRLGAALASLECSIPLLVTAFRDPEKF